MLLNVIAKVIFINSMWKRHQAYFVQKYRIYKQQQQKMQVKK